MRFLLLAGPKQSGKDTAFHILKEAGLVSHKVAFAGPLKNILNAQFGIHKNLLNDPIFKEKQLKEPITITRKDLNRIKWMMLEYVDPDSEGNFYNINKATSQGLENRVCNTPRELMQVIGTDFIRERILNEWHIKAMLSEKYLKECKVPKEGVVAITDCRFPNEYIVPKAKLRKEIVCVYVEREASEAGAVGSHASEAKTLEVKQLMLENNEIILKNNGSLEEFKETVLKTFGEIYEPRTSLKRSPIRG